MFIGVAKRQEGQENLFVADAEVVDENFGGARGIVQDRAMMLHHAARRAAGAAGIDQAGGVLALDAEAARLDFLKISLAPFDQPPPALDRPLAPLSDAQAFHRHEARTSAGFGKSVSVRVVSSVRRSINT